VVEKALVVRKLSKLKSYLEELRAYKNVSWEEYSRSFQHRRAVERLIQLIVDVAVDINTHMLVDQGYKPPKDGFNSFIDAAHMGVMPTDFAHQIAPSTGERNIIVHEYEVIDDAIIYQSIGRALSMYDQYISYVVDYLDSHID